MTRRLLLATTLAVLTAAVGAASTRAAAPVNTYAPQIEGQPYVGKTLTATPGGWQNSPTTYTYQWVRCDTHGAGCTQIAGATKQAYTPVSADVNHSLIVWVTASNKDGTVGPVNSKPTAAVTPALPPKSTAAPQVVGKPLVGEKLVADPGKYSGGAVASFAYQWQRCDAASITCTSITGATQQSYIVAKDDVGKRLRVEVTARNPFGQATTDSKATDAVTAPVVVETTTLAASTQTTKCCSSMRLSGTISPVKSGEQITILAREFDDIATYPVTTTTTDSAGNWSVLVTPTIQTSYEAQTSTSTSQPVTVFVHPRVGFGVNGNTFSAKVTGRDSFGGKIAYFQMRGPSGWKSLRIVVINQYSVARFRVPLPHGHTYVLRVYLPKAQAGPGYLDGVSMSQRVGGRR